MELEAFMQRWRITKRIDGETAETEYDMDEWVPIDDKGRVLHNNDPDITYSPMPTSYTGLTLRRRR